MVPPSGYWCPGVSTMASGAGATSHRPAPPHHPLGRCSGTRPCSSTPTGRAMCPSARTTRRSAGYPGFSTATRSLLPRASPSTRNASCNPSRTPAVTRMSSGERTIPRLSRRYSARWSRRSVRSVRPVATPLAASRHAPRHAGVSRDVMALFPGRRSITSGRAADRRAVRCEGGAGDVVGAGMPATGMPARGDVGVECCAARGDAAASPPGAGPDGRARGASAVAAAARATGPVSRRISRCGVIRVAPRSATR